MHQILKAPADTAQHVTIGGGDDEPIRHCSAKLLIELIGYCLVTFDSDWMTANHRSGKWRCGKPAAALHSLCKNWPSICGVLKWQGHCAVAFDLLEHRTGGLFESQHNTCQACLC